MNIPKDILDIIVNNAEHITFIKLRKVSSIFFSLCSLNRYVEMYKFEDKNKDMHCAMNLCGVMVPVNKDVPKHYVKYGHSNIELIVSIDRTPLYSNFKSEETTNKVRHGMWFSGVDDDKAIRPHYQMWYFGALKYYFDPSGFTSYREYNRFRILYYGEYGGKEIEYQNFPKSIKISYDQYGTIRKYRIGTYKSPF